jgi:hypothetical protein
MINIFLLFIYLRNKNNKYYFNNIYKSYNNNYYITKNNYKEILYKL